MSSGSAADVNNAGTLGRGTRGVNVNGNTSAGAYTLDGAYAPSAVPNPDTISELKIHTSQYDAVYGAQVPSTAWSPRAARKNSTATRGSSCATTSSTPTLSSATPPASRSPT